MRLIIPILIVLFGLQLSTTLRATELPFTMAWEEVPPLPDPEVNGGVGQGIISCTQLPDGRLLAHYRVLMEDGKSDSIGFAVFDPSTQTWSILDRTTARILERRLLPDGRVFLTAQEPATWLYDPSENAIHRIADRPEGMRLAPRGNEIIANGEVDGVYKTHVYDPDTDSWPEDTRAPADWQCPINYPNGNHLLSNGKQLYDGTPSSALQSTYLQIVDLFRWELGPPLVPPGTFEDEPVGRYHGLIDDQLVFTYSKYETYPEGLHNAQHLGVVSDAQIEITRTLPALPDWWWRAREGTVIVEAGGRDHLLLVEHMAFPFTPLDTFRVLALNWHDDTWDAGPSLTTPKLAMLHVMPLDDGALVEVECDDDSLMYRRLVVTPTVPPAPPGLQVSTTALAIWEGETATFQYRLTGDIPAAGIPVVVERVASSTGRVSVVENAGVRIHGRDHQVTVRLAAGIDADAADDEATIRVRMVPDAGSGIDPDAQTIAVTVRDIMSGDAASVGPLPGDGNDDGVVNALDLDEVVDHFGTTADER